jgi:hypothetical protein
MAGPLVDSDFVRVRGLPPAADELQFIDRSRIMEAQKRAADSLDDEPLICGVDVSGGGAAWNVIAYRRGGDARSIPRIRIPGEHTRDRSVLVGKLAEILRDQRPTRKVSAMFIDMAFGSPIYERLRALGFNNVFETNFGLVHTLSSVASREYFDYTRYASVRSISTGKDLPYRVLDSWLCSPVHLRCRKVQRRNRENEVS